MTEVRDFANFAKRSIQSLLNAAHESRRIEYHYAAANADAGPTAAGEIVPCPLLECQARVSNELPALFALAAAEVAASPYATRLVPFVYDCRDRLAAFANTVGESEGGSPALLAAADRLAVEAAVIAEPNAVAPTDGRGAAAEAIDKPKGEPSSPSQADTPPAPYAIHDAGDYFDVRFAGDEKQLKKSKGLGYITKLLREPYRKVDCVTLIPRGDRDPVLTERPRSRPARKAEFTKLVEKGGVKEGQSPQPPMDDEYKRAIVKRIEDLDEIKEMGLMLTDDQVEERKQLTKALEDAFGLNGRPRDLQPKSHSHKTYEAVTEAVRAALIRLEKSFPALHVHLKESITFDKPYLLYTPDRNGVLRDKRISWKID